MKTTTIRSLILLLLAASLTGSHAAEKRPNILMIMTDDVGVWNVGAYSHGMMVPTPNIDRVAKEGMLFTDHYAQPTCTPGRAAFITGQLPIRTGLTTVGMAGSPIGLDARDPTLAEVLKPLGYRCGQFGKNHLGDRNEHLPTVHGFDEFYGNLYHPQHRGGAGIGRLAEGRSFQPTLPSSRRAGLCGHRYRRPDG